MQNNMLRQIRPAFALLGVMSLLVGVLYPLFIMGIADGLFPRQAAGSLIEHAGQTVGSKWIGQDFTNPAYFWGRPSATGYDAAASGGSNLAPSSPQLLQDAQARALALRLADPAKVALVPVELVTASGSGLDPHISPAAARYQVPRVARARGLDEAVLYQLVADHTEGRLWGVWGEPRVNVLLLNLALPHE